jgi:L-asparaginase
MKIKFILTGGTIDSYYDGIKDAIVPNKKSIIPEYLKSLNLSYDISFKEICMKDSRDLDEKDRRAILKEVENSKEDTVIITHGTYTMPDTARYLKAHLKKDKIVILTGSMIPLQGFNMSTAPFNLGFSLAKSEDVQPGVYVCLNGRLFDADEVAKDLKKGKYFSIFSK